MSASQGFVRVLRSTDLAACEGLESQIRDIWVGSETVLVGRLNDGRVVAAAYRDAGGGVHAAAGPGNGRTSPDRDATDQASAGDDGP